MLIEENTVQAAAAITAYHNGTIEIGGQYWSIPVVLRGDTVEPMIRKTPTQLDRSDFFENVATADLPEIIIIGTGMKQQFIPPKVIADVAAYGVGIECMNTASACRTLVLLQGEGRDVWAWLWP